MGMLQMVLRTEGVLGLYRGISPTILGILPYAGLKFYVYQSLKQVGRTEASQGRHAAALGLPAPFGGCLSGVKTLGRQLAKVMRHPSMCEEPMQRLLLVHLWRHTW